LPAYIKTLPGVLDSETETDGNITVAFTDGQWLTIFNNRPAAAPADEVPYPKPGTKIAKSRDIATGSTLRIIEYFAGSQIDSKLTQMFNKKGYSNVVTTDASLQNIANTNNADATFVDTHGGSCRFLDRSDPNHTKTVLLFGMMTNTLAPYTFDPTTQTFTPIPNIARDPNTDGEITDGLIGFALNGYDDQITLCVLPAYLKQTWSFPSKSIIFNSVCESDTSISQTYKQMCFGAGTGAFVGYDETVLGTDAANDAGTLYEGLLGTHIFNSNVRGRAWNVSDFYNYMVQAGITTHMESLGIFKGTRIAHMLLTMGSGNFTGLCPGIQYMYTVDSQKQLVLVGDFGSQQGTVTVNGQTVGTTWTTGKITCDGISTDPNGPTFSGPVIVTYNGHKSNQVDLTQYVGDVHYEEDDQGSLIHTADAHLAMHADVHLYRTNPFQDPSRPSTSMGAVDSSTFKYNNTGSWTVDSATETISGSGTLPNGAYTGGLNQYAASFKLIYTSKLAEFIFDFESLNSYSLYENGKYAGMAEFTPLVGIYTHTSPNYVGMDMDSNLNILPYNGPHSTISAGGYSETSFINANFTATPTLDSTKQEDSSSD
jgi:hypothetical protein